ncbi:hypothetical protein BYT27DRAFT_7214247 [Phlegmacium glaucopus]|nr:hypothetical protein BYT27DRAFT_7214247 [Phlegmacium glaucopus]
MFPTPVGHQREFIVAEAHGCKPIKSCRRRRKLFNPPLTCYNSDSDNILVDSFPPRSADSKALRRLKARSIYPSSNSKSFISLQNRPLSQHELLCTKSSQTDISSFFESSVPVFTPAQVFPIAASRSTVFFYTKKSISSPPLFPFQTLPPSYSQPAQSVSSLTHHMNTDTEDDERGRNTIPQRTPPALGSRSTSSSNINLRGRLFGMASVNGAPRVRDKPICTTPGELCAGETETETDEPSRHLPTSRIIRASGPLVPPNPLQQQLTPLLFEFSRLLSVVPAIFGTIYNLYHVYRPPTYNTNNNRPPPERVDYFISALWAILTGYQCLSLTTGLLTRWRLYYPPLSTLVRLLALQGICWPATHLTLTILEHEKRPVITWALIATTTCMSRSVQIWVTSNLWWEKRDIHTKDRDRDGGHEPSGNGSLGPSSVIASIGRIGSSGKLTDAINATSAEENRRAYWKRWGGGGKWGGRRWNWKEVGLKCVLPAGVLYFIMAWAEQLRREWSVSQVC